MSKASKLPDAPAPAIERKPQRLGIWPASSHEALTESITALAGIQRRLMIGGRLPVAP